MMRRFAFVATVALSATSGLAAASVMTPDSSQRPVSEAHDDARAGSVFIADRTSDPRNGPDWAVRAYTGSTGMHCLAVGRIDERRFGRSDGAGGVDELAASDSGSCAEPSQTPFQVGVARYPPTTKQSGTAVLFATVDRSQVTAAEAVDPGGVTERLDLSDGALVDVFAGDLGSRPWTITFTLKDGTRQTETL